MKFSQTLTQHLEQAREWGEGMWHRGCRLKEVLAVRVLQVQMLCPGSLTPSAPPPASEMGTVRSVTYWLAEFFHFAYQHFIGNMTSMQTVGELTFSFTWEILDIFPCWKYISPALSLPSFSPFKKKKRSHLFLLVSHFYYTKIISDHGY